MTATCLKILQNGSIQRNASRFQYSYVWRECKIASWKSRKTSLTARSICLWSPAASKRWDGSIMHSFWASASHLPMGTGTQAWPQPWPSPLLQSATNITSKPMLLWQFPTYLKIKWKHSYLPFSTVLVKNPCRNDIFLGISSFCP